MIFDQYSVPLLALFCCTNFQWALPDPVCSIADAKLSECSKKFVEIEYMPLKYVKVGDKILLECPELNEADEETQTYAWTLPDLKDGDDKTTNQPKIDLAILSSLQNGQYTCNASNRKQKFRRVYKIEVGTPVQIEEKKEVKLVNYVEVGKKFAQACQATGIPKPTVKWFFNDKSIEVPGNLLEIPSMDHSNEGKYKCLAENKLGIDSIEFNVAVGVKPEILHKDTVDYQFEYGKPLFIDCNVAPGAIPVPKITWVVDEGQTVELTTLDNGTLKIDPVTEKFNGYLKCIAKNEVGQDEKQIDLHVCGKPYNLTKLHCGNQLNESTTILHNECLMVADNRQYFLKMQSDGNLVAYKGTYRAFGAPIWSSNVWATDSTGPNWILTLQSDGNVTVMGGKKDAEWYLPGDSATAKPWTSHKFVMQNSGRLEHILTDERTGETKILWKSCIHTDGGEINMNVDYKDDHEKCNHMDISACYERGLAGPKKAA